MLCQYPPSPAPMDVPGPVEQVFAFCTAYLLLLAVVLLALPMKLARRVIQIAFNLRRDSRIDGEVR